jgi:hypothetical protein
LPINTSEKLSTKIKNSKKYRKFRDTEFLAHPKFFSPLSKHPFTQVSNIEKKTGKDLKRREAKGGKGRTERRKFREGVEREQLPQK